MANPALNEKRVKTIREEDTDAGWGAPATLADGQGAAGSPPAAARTSAMTANGTFAKTFVLFLLVLRPAGAFGWAQTTVSTPTRSRSRLGHRVRLRRLGLALVCIFKPKTSPFVSPLVRAGRGRVVLGVISKGVRVTVERHRLPGDPGDGRVFFATLLLYVLGS